MQQNIIIKILQKLKSIFAAIGRRIAERYLRWKKKNTIGERIFDVCNLIALLFIGFVSLYPFWQIVAESFNEPLDAMKGGIYFFPREFSLIAYKTVFENSKLVTAFFISVARTVAGTVVSIIVTGLLAYALSKPALKGRRFFSLMCLATMFFSGGMIPTYLVISQLGLIDNFLVFILPCAVNVWNMIVLRTFFENIPVSLEESARLDGAGWYRIFFSIVFPLSAPAIATVCLFFAVGQWSAWFDAYIYVLDADWMYPMQTILMRIINGSAISGGDIVGGGNTGGTITVTADAIKLATIVVSTAPILCVYPFVQKYFVKGMLVGSVKE